MRNEEEHIRKTFRTQLLKNCVWRTAIIAVFFSVLLAVSPLRSYAQQRSKILHQTDYDRKDLRFGFFFGVPLSNYRIKHNQLYLSSANTNIEELSSPMDLGIKLGGIVNFRRNEYFDIRLLPTVAIYSRQILVNNDPDVIPKRGQAWLELPILLKYKSLRRGNMRMNMFAGFSPSFETNAQNLNSRKSLTRDARLRTVDFSFEYGAGMELFRQFFKLSPEIHFAHGLRNIVKPGIGSTTVTPIDYFGRMNTHTVSFILVFE